MTIYKLTIKAYDYWYTSDRDGFQIIKKFFLTKEKAEQWTVENSKYIYCGFNGATEAEKDYQMPKFKIEAVEVE